MPIDFGGVGTGAEGKHGLIFLLEAGVSGIVQVGGGMIAAMHDLPARCPVALRARVTIER
jgi:hypothetical protein